MAGHSKWSNIKHRKGRQDEARGKIFAKLAKEIYVAAKTGDPNPDMNPLLRLAITKAKAANMPNDKINNAVNKAANKNSGEDYEEIRYEGYGPFGIAIMVDCLTDNRNRTAASVRTNFKKNAGNLGTSGSVSYMFERKGVLVIETDLLEDEILELALTAGAEDIEFTKDSVTIFTTDKDFISVKEKLETAGIKEFLVAEVTYVPNNTMKLSDEDSRKVIKLIEELEDNEDVNNVYHNLA